MWWVLGPVLTSSKTHEFWLGLAGLASWCSGREGAETIPIEIQQVVFPGTWQGRKENTNQDPLSGILI